MGIFDSKNKSKQKTKQTQTSETGLADFLRPDVDRALGFARSRAESGGGLPNQLVAGLDPTAREGLKSSAAGAREIAPLLAQQRQGLSDTVSGKYTDPSTNPFFSGVADLVRREVTPVVDSRFNAAGAFGSPLHQIGLGEGITRQLAPHLFGAYQQERGIQDRAISNADAIAGRSATTGGNILQDVGGAFQRQEQAELDAERFRAEAGGASENDYLNALSQIGAFFRTEDSTATSKSKGKTKGSPGIGNQLIQLGGSIGAGAYGG